MKYLTFIINILRYLMDYITRYHAALMLILTGIYVLLTLLILNANRQNIKQIVQIESARVRPRVSVSMTKVRSMVYMVVKNSGLSSAYHVTIIFDPAVTANAMSYRREPYWTAQGISVLHPGQEMRDFVCDINKFMDEYAKTPFKVTLQYKSDNQTVFSDHFQYDAGFISYVVDSDPIE